MIKVPGLCLDTLVEKQKLHHIDLIKMDIEGAELAALHGGENLLRYQEPAPVLIFEYNHHVASRAGWDINDILYFIYDLGFFDKKY